MSICEPKGDAPYKELGQTSTTAWARAGLGVANTPTTHSLLMNVGWAPSFQGFGTTKADLPAKEQPAQLPRPVEQGGGRAHGTPAAANFILSWPNLIILSPKKWCPTIRE